MLSKRYETALKWEHDVGKRIVNELNLTLKDSRYCKVQSAGRNQFEVKDGFTRFVVNLEERTCGCKSWEISGMPCKHAAACINKIHGKVDQFCDAYYSKDMYTTAYSNMITPLPDLALLEETEVFPPKLKRLPGRPRTKRRKQEGEGPSSTQAQKSATVKCSNCQQLGHNKRGCQRAPVQPKRVKASQTVQVIFYT